MPFFQLTPVPIKLQLTSSSHSVLFCISITERTTTDN